jgi:hypothetical protein
MTKKTLLISLVLASLLLTACSPKTTINQPKDKISYPCLKDKTALDSLTANGNTMEFQQSSYGKMITSINGLTQSNGKYWQYSINNQSAQIGADAYKCQGSETITWELK